MYYKLTIYIRKTKPYKINQWYMEKDACTIYSIWDSPAVTWKRKKCEYTHTLPRETYNRVNFA